MNPDLPPPRSAKTPILVFFGIVGLSVVFFFLFTLPKWKKVAGIEPSAPAGPETAGEKPPATPAAPVAASTRPGKAPVKTGPVAYTSPQQLLTPFVAQLRESNFAGAMKLAGTAVDGSPGAEFLKQLLAEGGYALKSDGPGWVDAGQIGSTARFSLPLIPRVATTPPAAGGVWVDMERAKSTGWKMKRVLVQDSLIRQGADVLRTAGIVANAEELATPADPLMQSHDFLTGVLGRDFATARSLTNKEKVTQEKLAGLCIVFEEGEFQLAADRPVVVTAASDETAWAIVRVESPSKGLSSELGLEMHKNAAGEWTVEALDFSRLLESYVNTTGGGKTYYSPLVKSPQGGESLVLYFDFDSADIVPRAQRQLEIVAGLLSTDPARKLRITGHADDVGSDDYNLRLSAQRAKNVRAALHSLHVDPEQIQTIGFGATAPLAPNQTADGRSQNRRTEIYLDF